MREMPRIASLRTVLTRLLPVLATIIVVLHWHLLQLQPFPIISEPRLVLNTINYHPIPFSDASTPVEQVVLATEDFDLACLEKYFTRGEPCRTRSKPDIDVVWTWVNGSDPLFDAVKTETEQEIWLVDKPSRPPQSLTSQRCYR